MNISGKWKIKAKENEITKKMSYRTTITSKDLDGTVEFYTIFLQLVGEAKNKPIENDSYIIVKPENAWLSFFKKEDKTEIVAIVRDFEYEPVQSEQTFNSNDDDSNDDDLPF